jgi:filamentous hemagglutinin
MTTYTADGKHPELDLKDGKRAHKPNASYQIDDYHYETDEYRRPCLVWGALQLGDAKRRKSQTAVGHLGQPGDQGGHIIGTRFQGPGFAINEVPMARSLNLSAWKRLENKWAKLLADQHSVWVEVTVKYRGKSQRPCSLTARYSVDNKRVSKSVFKNE